MRYGLVRQILWFAAAVLVGGTSLAPALADDVSSRAKISGTWEGENNGKWILENKGDSFHVVYQERDEKVMDFECSTAGKECDVKVGGHGAKVILYYNGPLLVEMETRGSDVVKRRFGVDESGQELAVDLMPLVPSGKDSTAHFKRVQNQVSSR